MARTAGFQGDGPDRRSAHRRRWAGIALASLLIAGGLFGAPAQAAPGGLDSSFGDAGKVVTDFAGYRDGGTAVAVQADGKIIVVGQTDEADAAALIPSSDFALARYNRDGSLDKSFGKDGKVSTDFAGQSDTARAVAIQGDGKIVVAGDTIVARDDPGQYASDQDFALARYNADGTLDTTFGGDGRTTTDFRGSLTGVFSWDRALSVGIQANGKIVAAGWAQPGTNVDFGLVRYNADGTLDASFGGDGKVNTDFAGHGARAAALGIQADGGIVVAGSTAGDTDIPGSSDFALARYTPRGTLDHTFGGDGKVTTGFDRGGADGAAALAIQPDGRIIAAGGALNPADLYISSDFALARYNADGTPDSRFGNGGKTSTAFAGNASATGIALQADGKIVAVGSALSAAVPHTISFALVRYAADGAVDTDGGAERKVLFDFGGPLQFASGAAIQPDGRIVVAGFTAYCDCHFGPIDFALARFKAAGSWQYDPPGHRLNQCLNASSIDLNAVFGVTEQIACGQTITAGGRWRPAAFWYVNTAYDAVPPGYVPAASTPLADFVTKLKAVKVIADAGTKQERTFVFSPAEALRTDVTLNQVDPEAPGRPMAVTIPSVKSLSVGQHTIEVRWVLSAMHCDGFTDIEGYSCLPAGEVSLGTRSITFTKATP